MSYVIMQDTMEKALIYDKEIVDDKSQERAGLIYLLIHDSTFICRNNTQTNPYNTNIPLQNNKAFG